MDYAFEVRPWRLALYILWVLFALSILIAMDCIFVRLVNQMTEPSYVDGDTSITETAYMDGAEEQEPVVALRACGFGESTNYFGTPSVPSYKGILDSYKMRRRL